METTTNSDSYSRNETSLIREVFEYAHRYSGSIFVLHLGSEVVENQSIAADLALLHENHIKLLLVPSGQERINELLSAYKIETDLVDGVRISTPEAMPLIEMAAFDIAGRLMNQLAKFKVEALIGNWVRARSKGVREGIDYLATGMVDSLNVNLIRRSLEDDFIPILPCIGWSLMGEPYNISSIELASQLAISLGASKLFYVAESDYFANIVRAKKLVVRPASGRKEKTRISRLTAQTAKEILDSKLPKLSSQERVLLDNAIHACEGGVERVHFIDGRVDGALLKEIFSTSGCGTMIHTSPFEHIREMRKDDVPDVLRIMEPQVHKGYLLRRSEEELLKGLDEYVVFENDGKVRGCGALYQYDAENAEIAALAVDSAYKELGIGQRIVAYLLDKSKKKGLRRVFALTTSAPDWFLVMGFRQSTVEALPQKRLERYDAQRKSRVYCFDMLLLKNADILET